MKEQSKGIELMACGNYSTLVHHSESTFALQPTEPSVSSYRILVVDGDHAVREQGLDILEVAHVCSIHAETDSSLVRMEHEK